MEGDAICLMLWHNGMIIPKRTSKKSKLRDISLLARAIVEEPTGESLSDHPLPKVPARRKNPAAVALGKLGGKKGGDARAKKLTLSSEKRLRWKPHRRGGIDDLISAITTKHNRCDYYKVSGIVLEIVNGGWEDYFSPE